MSVHQCMLLLLYLGSHVQEPFSKMNMQNILNITEFANEISDRFVQVSIDRFVKKSKKRSTKFIKSLANRAKV